MNLLLTSIGKRVELITHLKTCFRVVGVDATDINPGKHFTDAFYRIPRCTSSSYLKEILQLCEKEEIQVLIPLYEKEFSVLNQGRKELEKRGVKLLLSEEAVISLCNDKIETAKFFDRHNLPAPKTYFNFALGGEAIFPLIIKPSDGMGSENVFRIKNTVELEFFYTYIENPVIQECVEGEEYTVDVLCDEEGKPLYIVPRIRLEIRSGEVSKSRVSMNYKVIEETKKLLACLREEGKVRGPLTLQCFVTGDNTIKWIEMNPRFGGGVPLSFAAGADYAKAIFMMCQGKEPVVSKEIKELIMLRYDQSVFDRWKD